MHAQFLRSTLFVAAIAAIAWPASAATCTPTGFQGLSAALVNPPHVTGEVDATGCDIGVYFADGIKASVRDADIHGALSFGVVVRGNSGNTDVDVQSSRIHDIGDTPLNGNQRGVGIYYRSESGTASGAISGNQLSRYQKAGIVANFSGTKVLVSGNTVTGAGPVGFIAQNGIQIGYGALAAVVGNTVTGHSYTGTSTVSGGIVVVGGPGYGLCPDLQPCAYTLNTVIAGNTVRNNDIGVFLTNITAAGEPAPMATNLTVASNTISSSALQNNYAGAGYQAGVSDVGNGDRILLNTISGPGYNPATAPGSTFAIDADPSYAPNARIFGNRIRP